MAQAKKIIKKPKSKVIHTKEDLVGADNDHSDKVIETIPVIQNDEYSTIDYSSFNSKFIDFIDRLWNHEFYWEPSDQCQSQFLFRYKLLQTISEIRYHINEKQIQTQILAQKYGTYDQSTDNWIIPPESNQQFQNELNSLNDKKIKSKSKKIKFSELEKFKLWRNEPFNDISLSVFELIFDFIDLDEDIDIMMKRNEMWVKKGRPLNEDGTYPSLEDLEQFSD